MRKTFILTLILCLGAAFVGFKAPAFEGVSSSDSINSSLSTSSSISSPSSSSTTSSSSSLTTSPSSDNPSPSLSSSTSNITVKPFVSNVEDMAQESVENGTRGLAHGHQWVDMGLPSGLLWATANIGASNAIEYGSYFAWGEIAPKESYTTTNCKTYKKNVKAFSGNSTNDAARALWGGQWRTPTLEEFEELRDNCEYKRIIREGKKYAVFISKVNGNELYFPQSGYMEGTNLCRGGQNGFYWTSNPCVQTKDAHSVYFVHGDMLDCYRDRAVGCAIRPVMK